MSTIDGIDERGVTDAGARLAERVYNAVSTDGDSTALGHASMASLLESRASSGDGPLADRDSALCAWGFTSGIAYALAMLESDRFEPAYEVAVRAIEPAWDAFRSWSGPDALEA